MVSASVRNCRLFLDDLLPSLFGKPLLKTSRIAVKPRPEGSPGAFEFKSAFQGELHVPS